MTPVYAHAGHWLVNVLYLVPVIFIAGVIAREKWRERREGSEEHPDHHSRD
jgi:hypothetical protein